MTKPRSVLIAIPAYDWKVNVILSTFTFQLLARAMDPEFGWQFSIAVVPEASPVHYARNLLIGIFLKESQADYLWFIDNDMMPDDSALELLGVDADIVSGRSLAARPTGRGIELVPTVYTARDPESGVFLGPNSSPSEPIDIVGAGSANLLIRRCVLEDARMHQEPTYTDLGGKQRSVLEEESFAPPIFRTLYKPNGQVLLSEDLDFVFRASQLGYRCKYQPRARMGHLKTVDLNGVEAMLSNARLKAEGPA